MSGTCRLCGSSNTAPWQEFEGFRYRACADCSAVWLDPLPDEDWGKSFYDVGYFAGGGRGGYRDYLADETQHRGNALARIELAKRFGAAPPATWLDIGCAAGFTLDEARKSGFNAFGVEISAWSRALASERFGLNVFAAPGDARRELSGKVDVVSLFQTLEHMPDPVAALMDARACLRAGGLLLIETWDRGSAVARVFGRHWQQITPPSVLWLLDRNSLTYALERAGFTVHATLRSSKMVTIGWALGILAEKQPRIFGPLLRVIGRSSLRGLAFKYGLGDLISVVAVAKGDIKRGRREVGRTPS